jgi:DNA-binding NtrC family response regulator
MTEQKAAVLIVDDQPNWRNLFSDLLEDEYQVTSVESYQEALEALKRDPPFHVAVVDIRLDDQDRSNEDGLCLIEEIKREKKPTKTIIVTGYPTFRTSRRAFRDLGVSDYVEKYPEDGKAFDVAGFRRAVSEAVKSSIESPPDQAKSEVSGAEDSLQQEMPSAGAESSKPIARWIWARRWKKVGAVSLVP